MSSSNAAHHVLLIKDSVCAECHISNFSCFCCCSIQKQVRLEFHYNGKSVRVCAFPTVP